MADKIKYWKVGDEVLDLAQELMRNHYEDALGAKIAFLFRSRGAKSGNRITLGTCIRIPEILKTICEYDYIIWLAHDVWVKYDEKQKSALLLHEISHIKLNWDDEGTPSYGIRRHDTEEFHHVVKLYGCWKHDLEDFANALENTEGRRRRRNFED